MFQNIQRVPARPAALSELASPLTTRRLKNNRKLFLTQVRTGVRFDVSVLQRFHRQSIDSVYFCNTFLKGFFWLLNNFLKSIINSNQPVVYFFFSLFFFFFFQSFSEFFYFLLYSVLSSRNVLFLLHHGDAQQHDYLFTSDTSYFLSVYRYVLVPFSQQIYNIKSLKIT